MSSVNNANLENVLRQIHKEHEAQSELALEEYRRSAQSLQDDSTMETGHQAEVLPSPKVTSSNAASESVEGKPPDHCN